MSHRRFSDRELLRIAKELLDFARSGINRPPDRLLEEAKEAVDRFARKSDDEISI